MKVRRAFLRWAIQVDQGGVPNFIGCGWSFDFGKPSREPYPFVVPIKLFLTRRDARVALKSVKGPKERGRFPSAKVVRVTVEVST